MKLSTLSKPLDWLIAHFCASIILFTHKLSRGTIKLLGLSILTFACLHLNNLVSASNISDIAINEILPDPNSQTFNYDTDGDGTAEIEDEFVEFHNTSATHIDISNWKIWDNQQSYTIPEGSVIPAGGYLIIVGDWLGSPVTPKSCVITYGRHGGNGFGNTGDVIALVNPENGEYIAAYYNADTLADLPSTFDGTTLIRATDFGDDSDGQSLTRTPDGNLVNPIQTGNPPTPVINDNCGNVNGDGTPISIDDLNGNNDGITEAANETAPNNTYIAGGSIVRRTIDENQLRAFQIVVRGENVAVNITGGDDADIFTIDARGRLSFLLAPDFEIPSDADQDNVYQIEVIANGSYGSDTQTIYITVRDKPDSENTHLFCSADIDCPMLNSIPLFHGKLSDGSQWMEQDTESMLTFIDAALCNEPELTAQIEFLYLALLGRAFDAHGLAWWINQALLQRDAAYSTEQAIENIVQGFLNSYEFQQTVLTHQLINTDGQWSNTELLDYLYAEMGREQDDEGFEFWLDYLAEYDLLQMLTAFSRSTTLACDGSASDSGFVIKRIGLEIKLLRTANERGLIPDRSWLRQVKSELLKNRNTILMEQYAIEALMQILVSNQKPAHYQQ